MGDNKKALRELLKTARRKDGNEMREVIERLRREKAEFEEKAKRAGDLKAAAQEEQRHVSSVQGKRLHLSG